MSDIKVLEHNYPVDQRAHTFFQSFIEITSSLDHLGETEVATIQAQSMALLQSRLKAYTINSSVRLDIAERIMASNLYTMGYYLRTLPHSLCLDTLRSTALVDIYEQGKAMVWQDVSKARLILRGILKHRIKVNNQAFNDTITHGIPLFFSSYDVDFFAHETPGSIDYPLSLDAMDTCGIEYMLNYLKMLSMENQFCRIFSPKDVTALLKGYSPSYRHDLINIFDIILLNLAGNALLQQPIELNITASSTMRLDTMLREVPPLKLKLILGNSSHAICHALGIEHEGMKHLITQSLMKQSARITQAIENHCLHRVFVPFKAESPTLTFDEGASMDDVTFRKVTREIRSSRSEDKPILIRQYAKSFTDLMDMLEAYCIVDDEHTLLYQTLSDMELALLLTRTSDDDLHTSESQHIWQGWLHRFIHSQDMTKQKRIMALFQSIIESAP